MITNEIKTYSILILVLLPFISGIFSFFIKSDLFRRIIMIVVSLIHFIMVCYISLDNSFIFQVYDDDAIIGIDSYQNLIVLFISSLLFLVASIYSYGYLKVEKNISRSIDNILFKNEPESLFTGFMLLFLSSMSLVTLSNHMGLMWASIEATTLFSAPLIYFHMNKNSLEAVWKYVVICSVGIALALISVFLLSLSINKLSGDLSFTKMMIYYDKIDLKWFKLAFIFAFIGYGTKMGIVPMHSWLPDAHTQSPSVLSALLSGALLNCAFLGIYKMFKLSINLNLIEFSTDIFIFFALLSIVTASIFMINQKDYKRLLAYSSIENMAILILALGLKSNKHDLLADKIVNINMIGHSLSKALLFLVSGMILIKYKSRDIKSISLLKNKDVKLAVLWFIGLFFIIGVPPSILIFSKIGLFKLLLHKSLFYFLVVLISFIIMIYSFSNAFFTMVYSDGVIVENGNGFHITMYIALYILIIFMIFFFLNGVIYEF